MAKARYPRISSLSRRRTSAPIWPIWARNFLATTKLKPLPLPAGPNSAHRRQPHRQSLCHSADGRVGWDRRRPAGRLTRRRWRNFGRSGAKLIWGWRGVCRGAEGRANPNQLMAREENRAGMAELRDILLAAHSERFGTTDDLLLGLQLTHSGRFCRPWRKDQAAPAILYHHPILDRKFGLDADYPLLTDTYIKKLIDRYIVGAQIAHELGYHFVDIKHCHGYLGHEFLSAFTRPGPFGGPCQSHALCPLHHRGNPQPSTRSRHRRAAERFRLRALPFRSKRGQGARGTRAVPKLPALRVWLWN